MFIALTAIGVLAASSSVGTSSTQSAAELYQLPLYPGGVAPKAALVRDLDADGRVEVVVPLATWGGVRGIMVMRGQPDGSLGDSTTYPIDAWPTFIDSADLDHDGLLDLVVCCLKTSGGGGTVAVLLARGAGVFHQAREVDIDATPTALALGDVDEDGNIDVVVNDDIWFGAHGSRLLLGHGDGTFDAPTAVTVSEQLKSPHLVDVDGDGHLDLVAVAEAFGPTTVDWFLQTQLGGGDGTFASPSRISLPPHSGQLAMFDFDGDGRSDAVASSTFTAFMVPGVVQLYPALPSGTFGAPTTLWTGYSAGRSAIADIDGDGHMDVAIPHPQQLTGGGGVSLARGLGGYAFAPTKEVRTGSSVVACYCGDIEGDGALDFVTLNEMAHDTVGVVHAISPGEFDTGLAPVALPPNSGGVITGDIDGDGRIDLALIDSASNVALRRNLGHGRFGSARTLAASTTLEQVALHDFNGDGRADIAAVGAAYYPGAGQPGTLSVWRSTPQGFAVRDDYDLAVGNHSLACADFDGDGRDDLAVGCAGTVLIFHANIDGTFALAGTVVMDFQSVSSSRLVAGDFDGDGNIDLASTPLDQLVIAYGLGWGKFVGPVTVPIYGPNLIVGVGDLDRDGIDDLVVSVFGGYSQQDETALLFGHAGRSFDHRRLTEQDNFRQVLVGDFDGDGAPDLAGLEYDTLVVLTGDGRRGFKHQLSYGTGSYGQAAAADFNGDGRLDLAFTFAQENLLAVMLHR